MEFACNLRSYDFSKSSLVGSVDILVVLLGLEFSLEPFSFNEV
jgi:hypothetical protein